jgi:hypothetical protein
MFLLQVEYEIKSCSSTDTAVNGCVDVKRTNFTMPTTGYLIYGVAHQHTGGIGSTLYGKVTSTFKLQFCSDVLSSHLDMAGSSFFHLLLSESFLIIFHFTLRESA